MGLFFLIFGVACIFLGVVFLAVTYFASKHQTGLEERCRASAEAKLVGNARRTTEFGNRIEVQYHGVYTFTASDGLRVRAENENGYARPADIPGPSVAILYNPNDPKEFLLSEEHARIVGSNIPAGLRRTGILMLVLGVPLLIAGVVFWRTMGDLLP